MTGSAGRMDSMIDYKADAKAPEVPQEELIRLVDALIEARREEEAAEEDLKRKKAFRTDLEEHKIPEKLAEFGVVAKDSTLRLTNGRTIKLESQEYVSVPEANRPAAFQWLRDNGYGRLIQEKVVEQKVEPGHLRSLSSGGVELPKELFNVYEKKKVKIK